MENKKKVVIIGSGFGGLGTACILSKAGYDVSIYEKNERFGGRANLLVEKGFTFDMGPSWYMMPDVFEHFYKLMDEDVNEHLKLERLSPSYRIFLKSEDKYYDFYSDLEKTKEQFENIEPGSAKKLEKYLDIAKEQYEISYNEFLFKNYDSIFDFFNKRVMTNGRKLPIFKNMKNYVNEYFKSEILQKVLQFQTVLLGTAPKDTPAIYSLMNHVDFNLGIWYPQGGFYEVIKSLVKIAEKNGAKFYNNSPIEKIIVENGKTTGIKLANRETIQADIVISNADINHTEQNLLEEKYRTFSKKYWESKTMAPSGFIMYIGLKDKAENLAHHNLVFSKDWNLNFKQIFKDIVWPEDPSIYVCCPSILDPSVAPEGKENLFVLVPIGAGQNYTEEELDDFKEKMLDAMQENMGIKNIRDRIEYLKTYCVKDFVKDYNSYKGSALGLAHTLKQTAFFRPNNITKKVKDLYFVGGQTNPGIGVPICLISAELIYKRIKGIKDPSPLSEIKKEFDK